VTRDRRVADTLVFMPAPERASNGLGQTGGSIHGRCPAFEPPLTVGRYGKRTNRPPHRPAQNERRQSPRRFLSPRYDDGDHGDPDRGWRIRPDGLKL